MFLVIWFSALVQQIEFYVHVIFKTMDRTYYELQNKNEHEMQKRTS